MSSHRSVLECVDADRREVIEDRVDDVLSELTVEQKVGQLNQVNADFETGTPVGSMDEEEGVESGEIGSLLNVADREEARRFQEIAVEESDHGIPILIGLDVVHGHETIFPIPLGEAASWNPALLERSADAAATEAAADGVHWTFAPSVDVTRDARWGRVMEAAGEDPYLGSEIARARVRGFQGEDLAAEDTVLACAKHYLGYGASEAGRDYNTVDVSETNLREVHLPPFEACVDAGVASVMNAFNVHERIPASGSEFLVDELLREEVGFDGAVISDWNSFGEMVEHGVAADLEEAAELAIEAGSDIDMVSGAFPEHLADLVREGVVSEERLDEAVRRVLELKGAAGLFEDPFAGLEVDRDERVLTDDHRELAREVARESQVLLHNDGVLPLDSDADVALVGALADSADDMLGAWRDDGDPADVVTLRETLEERLGDDLTYAAGCDRDGSVGDAQRGTALAAAREADVVVAAVSERYEQTGEAASRARLDLPGDQRALLESLVETGTPVVTVLFSGRPLALEWTAENVPALVASWFPGVEAGPAVADVLYGDCDASGRLPMTFPVTEGQCPVYYSRLPTGRPPEDVDLSEPPSSPDEKYVSRYLDAPNGGLYPFGHGESYAEFDYREVALSTDELAPGEELTVTVTVANTSDRAGDEVVQLYVHDHVGSRSRPQKELVGFEKVTIEAGETREVDLSVTTEDLAFWTADRTREAEPGTFTAMVGRSAADIVAKETFDLRE